ncbi:MAG: hypothetical protein AAGN66_23540 [Acidobacteriota bacterium]
MAAVTPRSEPQTPPPGGVLRFLLLPTGVQADDYHCAVDTSGVFAVDRDFGLEVWAARPHPDPAPLAAAIRRALEEGSDPVATNGLGSDDDPSPSMETVRRKAVGFGIAFLASLASIRAFPSPVLVAIFLASAFVLLGLCTHHTVRFFEVRSRLAAKARRAGERWAALSREIRDMGASRLTAAVAPPKVHPVLETVRAHFLELEGRPARATDAEPAAAEGTAPDVTKALASAAYRSRVPSIYHPLLDAQGASNTADIGLTASR